MAPLGAPNRAGEGAMLHTTSGLPVIQELKCLAASSSDSLACQEPTWSKQTGALC
jgi:hypothetical protein